MKRRITQALICIVFATFLCGMANYGTKLIVLNWENEDGQSFRVQCERIMVANEDADGWETLSVTVYQEGKWGAIQTFETPDFYAKYNKHPITLVDINSDGYLDIQLLRYDFSSRTVFEHYIWSPGKGKFVAGPEELWACSHYRVEEETRKIYVYTYYGGAHSQTYAYQWEDEMNLKLVGLLETWDVSMDEMSFEIISYEEDGEERVILDYITDEPWEVKSFAELLYGENILCELEIQEEYTGKHYQIYLAQEEISGEYEERLYIVDESLQPVALLTWKSNSAYKEMKWITKEYGTDKLQILYEDGSTKEFALEELIGE